MPTSPLTLVRSRGPILADASRRRRRPATLEAKIATIRRTRPELAAHIEALVDDLLTTMQGRREPETSLGAVAGVLIVVGNWLSKHTVIRAGAYAPLM